MVRKYLDFKKILAIAGGVFIQAGAIKYFYYPTRLFPTGLSGISIVLSDLTGLKDYSLWYFLLNLPLIILSFFKIGKRFTFFTFIAIGLFTVYSQILPPQLINLSQDRLLMAIFGGIILGLGVALPFKVGGSTGGMDIIAIYLSERFKKSTGFYILYVNLCIILAIGLLYDVETALFTIVALFATTVMIDRIHRRYKRQTLLIITKKPDDMVKGLLEGSQRGITKVQATGGYSGEGKAILYIVALSHEYMNIVDKALNIDPEVFINVVNSVEVFGKFETPKIDDI